jgi:hypothetical protein
VSGSPGADPDRLLEELRRAAGPPPLVPLALAPPPDSQRPGLLGGATSALRRAVMRLVEPALADLVGQLERDRHRTRAEIARLEERVARLEAAAPD